MKTAKSGNTFRGVQALRAIAALLVVLVHCIYLWLARVLHQPNAEHWMNGAAGVDIFFVISGFVMTVSLPSIARNSHPIQVFLQRRITRIVPLYWLATTLRIALLLLLPGLKLHHDLTIPSVVGSYLFVPVLNSVNILAPVLIVGWTLNFEMFFYLMFSFSMLFRGRQFAILAPLLMSLATVGAFYRPSWPSITSLASPILLEFLFGVCIARLAMANRLPGKPISWTFLAAGFLSILTICPHLPAEKYGTESRFLLWGVPAAAIVLGAVGLEERFGVSIPKWLTSLGDASYAIYLVQTFVLPAVGIAVVKLGLVGNQALAACIVGGIILSAVSGEVVHRFVELPILAFLKARQQRGAGVAV